jgi:hypothetical protein
LKRNLGKERVGQIRINTYGSLMEVIEYKKADDIIVKFIEHGNLAHATWKNFCNGKVKNVYDRSVYEIGYLGEGKYKCYENDHTTPYYRIWIDMLRRCYNNNFQKKFPTYKDCTVCEEWHNFQNFAEWYENNHYEINDEQVHLDKDILIKENKLYSPETCIFVPSCINLLFLKNKLNRGNLPIGVIYKKDTNKYIAKFTHTVNGSKITVNIGVFNTPENAFKAYKLYKEKEVKCIANLYKDKIPEKLYNTMMKYEVEIND